ncbi:hypothetical protein DNU06_04570 [Putridiphycobacter roseus]|uniref:Uncharacterized protein n=1 Tax=Putridiphycobacter roseus TaxID=2219161 RepID=A0A2W1NIW3_9FLAO|nr:hypothetical protein [Putridiphycobacter roseus]PZE17896.1 hypothetical protein DNU06_04570 [Putridiphycobacter roseus]
MIIYPQGKTYPPTGQGVGILLIVLGLLPLSSLFSNAAAVLQIGLYLLLTFPLTFLGCWLLFAKSEVLINHSPVNYFVESKGFLFLKIKKKVSLADYELGVIKKMNIVYSVKQGIGNGVSLAEGNYKESYFARHLKKNKIYDFNMVFKGSESQVMDFVKINLVNTHLLFFHGAIHKERQLFFN